MKSKKMIAAVVFAVVSAFAVFALAGCNRVASFEPAAENLAEGATYVYEDGAEKSAMHLNGNAPAAVTVRFKSAIRFNTVMLKASNDNVSAFEILIGGESVYRQDEIGSVRTCWLGDRTADEIVVRVTEADGNFNIHWLGVYEMPRERDFRVTTYLETGADFALEAALDGESLKYATTVIVFNSEDYHLNAASNLEINEPALSRVLSFIRAANPEIEIILNILQKDENGLDWPYSVAKTYTDAFTNDPDRLVGAIDELLRRYDLDGVGFDYEYPQTKSDWKVFSDFLVSLKKTIGEKKISTAIQYLGGDFTKQAKDAIDYYEVMCYDFIGKNNSHSTFADAVVGAIEYLEKEGLNLRKVNLGLPFYSRPQTKTGEWSLQSYWGDYKSYKELLGKYQNTLQVNKEIDGMVIGTLYFNSYQMIADKTAFAYDYGVGGVMIWNYASDAPYSDPLSLHRAVNDALQKI